MGRKRQRWLYGLLLLLFGAAVLLIGLPLWMPWVLAPLSRQFDLRYSSYQRRGFVQFVLHDVHYSGDSFDWRAERVQALLPYDWLWRRLTGKRNSDFARADGWELRWRGEPTAAPGQTHAPPIPKASATTIPQDLTAAQTRIHLAENWLPHAQLRDGRVFIGTTNFDVPTATWNSGVLTATVFAPFAHVTATVRADFRTASRWQMQIDSEPLASSLTATARWTSQSVDLAGTARWQTNTLDWAVAIGASSWLPTEARASAEHLGIQAKELGLDGYSVVHGSLAGRWNNGRYQLQVRAEAQPLPARAQQLFPAALEVRLSGDTNQIRIEQANVRTPFLQGDVAPGTTLDYSGKLTSPEARLDFVAELARQPWFRATGTLRAHCVSRPSTHSLPEVQFDLSGQDCAAFQLRLASLDFAGLLQWPGLRLERGQVRFAEGGTAALIASADLQQRYISNAVLHVEGRLAEGLLPPSVAYSGLMLHLNVEGPLKQLVHSGVVEVHGLTNASLAPLDLQARWHGKGEELDAFQGAVAAGDARLDFAGAAKSDQGGAGLNFESFEFRRAGRLVYTLVQPFAVSLDADKSHERGRQWLLRVQPFQWRGEARNLELAADVAWPVRGRFHLAAHHFDTAEFGGFFRQAPPSVAIDELNTTGAWTNGPVQLELTAATHLSGKTPIPLSLRVEAEGNASAVRVRSLQVKSDAAVVLQGDGSFPLRIVPEAHPLVQIDYEQPVALRAATAPDPAFWDTISRWIKVRLTDPRVRIALSGPLHNPTGSVEALVAAIRPGSLLTNRELPRIEDVRAHVELTRAAVELRQFTLKVEGQPISATAHVPVGPDVSTHWRKFFHWAEASGTAQVADAQLAPFARFAPKVMAPQGVMEAMIQLRPNWQWSGQLVISNAATRPLPSLGPIDQLQARVRLAGRRVEVQTFTGTLGGEPFGITGNVDLGIQDPRTGLPRLQLAMRGSSLPLVRQPGIILRSDIDLSLTSATNGQGHVAGNVHLRDSVFLSDLRALVPQRAAAPKERPPYFSIDSPPFSDWGMNIHVIGDKFLKVRSPFFQGQISTDMKLEGTLREPMALGDITVNSGTVLFPFANLDVTQGLVSLSSSDPYRPRLYLSAGAKAMGFDVRMEVTGYADNPVLQFTSTPPMSSEQVLLMLTAGDLPRQDTTLSTQQRAGRLALFLGKSLLSEFGGPQATADKLTIRSGEYLSQQGQQTYSLEYRLNPRWSIEGEYDRFGAFNADLKWHLYSR